jgi:hypothetical protein
MHYDPQSDFETSSYNCDFRDLQISENDGYLHITQTFYGNCDLSGVHYIYLYEKPYPDANIAALYLYGGNTYLDKEGRSTIINGFTAVPSSGSTNQVTFEIPISLIPLNLHNQDIWVSAYMDSYDSMPDSTVAYFSWGCTQDTLGDRRCGTSMGYGAAQECQFDIQANRPAWTVVDLCDAAGESCDLATTSCYSGNPNSILPYLDPLGDHESGTYGCDIRDIQVTETLGTLNFNFIFYSACDISSGTNDLYLMDTHQADRVVLSLYSGTLSVYYYDSGTSAWSLEPVLPTSFTATPSTGITSSISFHIAVSDIPHLDLSPSMFFVYLGVGPSVGVYTDIANDEYYSIFSW